MKQQAPNNLEMKQTFLRSQIIDAGVDPESFMVFMGAAKGEGENINLENWTLQELKNIVNQFKVSLEQQLKRQKQLHQSKFTGAQALARNRSSIQVVDRVMGSNLPKKQKVFYQKDDLWDFQLKTKEQCKKTHRFFNFNNYPQINCRNVQIKKVGGFIFGIGGKYCIQFVLTSNFSSNPVQRKSQDVDWLRASLISQFPGSFVPPLQPTPVFQPQDKQIAAKRTRQVLFFLNSLVHYDYLLNNKFTHMFFTQNDSKAFQNFKTKNIAVSPLSNTSAIQNLQGFYPVQISQRMSQLIKNTGKFSKQIAQIYKNIQITVKKVQSDFQSLGKHSQLLASDFGKLSQKIITIEEKSNLSQSIYINENNENFETIFSQLKTVFSTLQNHSKKQAAMMREFTQDNLKYFGNQWIQFDQLQKKYRRQLDTYLTIKSSLSKKKQQFFLDISKKQLQQRERTGVSKQTTLSQKQELYKSTYAKQNKLEEERRKWQGYLNNIFEKSFMSLLAEQQKQIQRKLHKIYSAMPKLLNDRSQIYSGFDKYMKQAHLKRQKQN